MTPFYAFLVHWILSFDDIMKKTGGGCCDRMVVGFTTYATTDVASSNLDQGKMYNIMW